MSALSESAASSAQRLRLLKRTLERLWIFSPERLWLLSIALQVRGRWLLAFAVKQLNTALYHNSLAPEAIVGADLRLGHHSHGIVVNGNVEIGDRVKIWHNVTLTAGRPPRHNGEAEGAAPARIVIEQDVKIGANAVVIAPRGTSLRIGRGARIGAGAIVTRDIPARATVVSPPSRILLEDPANDDVEGDQAGSDLLCADSSDAALDAASGSSLDGANEWRPGRKAPERP